MGKFNKPVSSCLWWCISLTNKEENFWMYLLLGWTQLLGAYRIFNKSWQSYQDMIYSNSKLKKDFHRPFWYNSFSMDTQNELIFLKLLGNLFLNIWCLVIQIIYKPLKFIHKEIFNQNCNHSCQWWVLITLKVRILKWFILSFNSVVGIEVYKQSLFSVRPNPSL